MRAEDTSTTIRSGMTLAFELSALQQFADPNAVLEDARQWSQYVGVVANEPGGSTAGRSRRLGVHPRDRGCGES